MVEQMLRRGIIKEKDGKLSVTAIGKVASLFYYCPFDVADLKRNFDTLFDYEKEYDELWIATALAKINGNKSGFVSSAEGEQMEHFLNKLEYDIRNAFGKMKGFTPPVNKMIFCNYSMLNGYNNPVFNAALRGLQMDKDRLIQVLMTLDGMMAKWGKHDYFKRLSRRMGYGVPWELLDLCDIPGVGKVKASKLWRAGLKKPSDVVERPRLAQSSLGCSDRVFVKMLVEAKKVSPS